MSSADRDLGMQNPNAPPELAQFAFLIGAWRFNARFLPVDGQSQDFTGAWTGRYILDGYAIADEYRMTSPSGELIVLGMNVRTFQASNKLWNLKWLNALDGSWTDLVSGELGGVTVDGASIRYAFREPVAAHAYTRATYIRNSPHNFTWRGEKSEDAKSWTEFMVVDAHREKD
jgi:hypothetical protein